MLIARRNESVGDAPPPFLWIDGQETELDLIGLTDLREGRAGGADRDGTHHALIVVSHQEEPVSKSSSCVSEGVPIGAARVQLTCGVVGRDADPPDVV